MIAHKSVILNKATDGELMLSKKITERLSNMLGKVNLAPFVFAKAATLIAWCIPSEERVFSYDDSDLAKFDAKKME